MPDPALESARLKPENMTFTQRLERFERRVESQIGRQVTDKEWERLAEQLGKRRTREYAASYKGPAFLSKK